MRNAKLLQVPNAAGNTITNEELERCAEVGTQLFLGENLDDETGNLVLANFGPMAMELLQLRRAMGVIADLSNGSTQLIPAPSRR